MLDADVADCNCASTARRFANHKSGYPQLRRPISPAILPNCTLLAYRGGSLGDERVFSMGAILVRHPQGTLLFDSGFGSRVDQHFLTTPWLMQVTSTYAKEATVAR